MEVHHRALPSLSRLDNSMRGNYRFRQFWGDGVLDFSYGSDIVLLLWFTSTAERMKGSRRESPKSGVEE